MPGKPAGPPGGGGTPEFAGLWGGRPPAWAAGSFILYLAWSLRTPSAKGIMPAAQSPAAAGSCACTVSDDAGDMLPAQICQWRQPFITTAEESNAPGGGGGKGCPGMGMCGLSGGGMGGGGPRGLLMCPGTPLIAGGGPENAHKISLMLFDSTLQRLLHHLESAGAPSSTIAREVFNGCLQQKAQAWQYLDADCQMLGVFGEAPQGEGILGVHAAYAGAAKLQVRPAARAGQAAQERPAAQRCPSCLRLRHALALASFAAAAAAAAAADSSCEAVPPAPPSSSQPAHMHRIEHHSQAFTKHQLCRDQTEAPSIRAP